MSLTMEAFHRGITAPAAKTLATYGLTQDDWIQLLKDQDWKCPICLQGNDRPKTGKQALWNTDPSLPSGSLDTEGLLQAFHKFIRSWTQYRFRDLARSFGPGSSAPEVISPLGRQRLVIFIPRTANGDRSRVGTTPLYHQSSVDRTPSQHAGKRGVGPYPLEHYRSLHAKHDRHQFQERIIAVIEQTARFTERGRSQNLEPLYAILPDARHRCERGYPFLRFNNNDPQLMIVIERLCAAQMPVMIEERVFEKAG